MLAKMEKYREKQESNYHKKKIRISVTFSGKEKERERMGPQGNLWGTGSAHFLDLGNGDMAFTL